MAISGTKKIDKLDRLTTVTVSGSTFTLPVGVLPIKPSARARANIKMVAASTQRLRRLSRISFWAMMRVGDMVFLCGFLLCVLIRFQAALGLRLLVRYTSSRFKNSAYTSSSVGVWMSMAVILSKLPSSCSRAAFSLAWHSLM